MPPPPTTTSTKTTTTMTTMRGGRRLPYGFGDNPGRLWRPRHTGASSAGRRGSRGNEEGAEAIAGSIEDRGRSSVEEEIEDRWGIKDRGGDDRGSRLEANLGSRGVARGSRRRREQRDEQQRQQQKQEELAAPSGEVASRISHARFKKTRRNYSEFDGRPLQHNASPKRAEGDAVSMIVDGFQIRRRACTALAR